jgi:putative hydrolase of the HAD superfamily
MRPSGTAPLPSDGAGECERYNRRVRFTTIFFDLDDTLYPASSGLWPALKERMTRYMIERMNIPDHDVPRLRETYFRKYGTTLRGLQANHKIDVEDYLAYVHDVHLADYIHPDPVQQSVLSRLPTRNLILTNADANHVRRVLGALKIEEHFADVVDINRMEPYCKPSPEAFALAMKTAGEREPSRCVMIDDLPHTTRAAKALGFYALLYGAPAAGTEADAAFSDWPSLPLLLDGARG